MEALQEASRKQWQKLTPGVDYHISYMNPKDDPVGMALTQVAKDSGSRKAEPTAV